MNDATERPTDVEIDTMMDEMEEAWSNEGRGQARRVLRRWLAAFEARTGVKHAGPEAGFAVGDRVEKVGGDYRFAGAVVAAFGKLSGVRRYVVEDDRGVLHIYSDKNLAGRPTSAPAAGGEGREGSP
jgi:hypothetical protein